jgi:hypothetical protein
MESDSSELTSISSQARAFLQVSTSHTSLGLPVKSHEIIVLSSDNKDDDNKL